MRLLDLPRFRHLAVWLACFAALAAGALAAEPLVLPVWPGVPPGSEGKDAPEKVRLYEGEHVFSSVHRPNLTISLPATPAANRAAVLVIPGGGHREIWFDHEGTAIARALNERGIAAFLLKYRLAREPGSTYSVERDSLADAQRAMQLIRSRAREFGIDPAHLGVMGFSAGGQLAALTASHTLPGDPNATDVVARESSRPAFQGLIYPAQARTFEPAEGAPPVFVLVGDKDETVHTVDVVNAYLRFHDAGVPAELHVLTRSGHGFGLRARNHGAEADWLNTFVTWMNTTLASRQP
jgi:endo-1,4-beta-xylanase